MVSRGELSYFIGNQSVKDFSGPLRVVLHNWPFALCQRAVFFKNGYWHLNFPKIMKQPREIKLFLHLSRKAGFRAQQLREMGHLDCVSDSLFAAEVYRKGKHLYEIFYLTGREGEPVVVFRKLLFIAAVFDMSQNVVTGVSLFKKSKLFRRKGNADSALNGIEDTIPVIVPVSKNIYSVRQVNSEYIFFVSKCVNFCVFIGEMMIENDIG